MNKAKENKIILHTEEDAFCECNQCKDNREDTDFITIERFIQNWREHLIISGFKREETYNSFMPTDSDIARINKLIRRKDE